MRIKLINYADAYSVISDSYPEEQEYYDLVMRTIRGCIAGTHATLEFAVDGNCVIIPAEIVKQSIITVINESKEQSD